MVSDSIDIESEADTEETTPADRFAAVRRPPPGMPPKVAQRQMIRARLRSGRPEDDGDETTFSMFGTDRAIKSFNLEIHPLAETQESCKAMGSVSYTTEDGIKDDWIIFYLLVKPETFARYAAKIADGSVDEMILSVGSVAGFYSKWEPVEVSTRKVKVLAGDEHKITLPSAHQIDPPRLGHVGAAELFINRRLEFRKRGAQEPDAIDDKVGTELVLTTQSPAADPRTLQMLGSLRQAAWFIVCLLALIFIVTLLKR
jgi:hypothetical protein